MRPLYVVLVFVCLFFACCFVPKYLMEEPAPTLVVVPGSYRGEYQDGVETIEVRSDSRYVQEFRRGGAVVYRNEGIWHIAGNQVVFDKFLVAIDHNKRVEQQWGMWVDFGGGYSIVFDIDYKYSVSRKDTPAEKSAR